MPSLDMTPKMLKWLIWQVAVPILGPILISAIVIALWLSGQNDFRFNWAAIAEDVTPWALTFYGITLIGGTISDLWSKLPAHPVVGGSLIVMALTVAIYGAFQIIWRSTNHNAPGTAVWIVTLILLGISIGLCYKGTELS